VRRRDSACCCCTGRLFVRALRASRQHGPCNTTSTDPPRAPQRWARRQRPQRRRECRRLSAAARCCAIAAARAVARCAAPAACTGAWARRPHAPPARSCTRVLLRRCSQCAADGMRVVMLQAAALVAAAGSGTRAPRRAGWEHGHSGSSAATMCAARSCTFGGGPWRVCCWCHRRVAGVGSVCLCGAVRQNHTVRPARTRVTRVSVTLSQFAGSK
jgi:hypothetical protein